MPNSIEFMDCSGCGKRVRTRALRCHHCGRNLESDLRESLDDSDSVDDDFDYEEFLEREFGQKRSNSRKPWWWYVAWVVLLVMLLGIAMDGLRLIPRGS